MIQLVPPDATSADQQPEPGEPKYEDACTDAQVEREDATAKTPQFKRAISKVRRLAMAMLAHEDDTQAFATLAALAMLPNERVHMACDLYIEVRKWGASCDDAGLLELLLALNRVLRLWHQIGGRPYHIWPLPSQGAG